LNERTHTASKKPHIFNKRLLNKIADMKEWRRKREGKKEREKERKRKAKSY